MNENLRSWFALFRCSPIHAIDEMLRLMHAFGWRLAIMGPRTDDESKLMTEYAMQRLLTMLDSKGDEQ